MIERHTLGNGLTLLLKESHNVPIITWWVVYRVGSRHERTGQTGSSHWVEHMLFKGTPKFAAGYLDKAIDRAGGTWNAHTWLDHTAYHETLPADRIDLALELEADRMTNAQFDPTEVESERTVIISERQGSENSPLFWLREAVQATAFRVHPYHHLIIGDSVDLQSMTRDDLYQHYQRHYMPNNAIAIAVGAFNSTEMLARIKAYYADIPAGTPPTPFTRTEPPQQGERRIYVERPGNASYVQIAYRAPAFSHPDWFKLAALDSILGGPGGPGGGAIGHRTSRLYRHLIETEIAAGVAGDLSMTVDPYLYKLTAVLRDGRTHQEAEVALLEQIERLQHEQVSEAELHKAKKQTRAAFAYSNERVGGQAYYLSYTETIESYHLFLSYPERIEAITAADIQDVAQRYLQPSQRTIGWFIPQ